MRYTREFIAKSSLKLLVTVVGISRYFLPLGWLMTASFVQAQNCVTAQATAGWVNTAFDAQINTFQMEVDLIPSMDKIDAVFALSNGPQTSYGMFGALVRLNKDGNIDVHDSNDNYSALKTISYRAGLVYRFRMIVATAGKFYTVWVRRPNEPEVLIAQVRNFRLPLTRLDNSGAIVGTPFGSLRACNVRLTSALDNFKATRLYPTAPNGRTWVSKWGNGYAREFAPMAWDPYDGEFQARGSGWTAKVDGSGTLRANGDVIRMYIYDRAGLKKWDDVETTVYAAKKNGVGGQYAGIVTAAKSNHALSSSNPCQARGYYGRLRNDSLADVVKELEHGSKPIYGNASSVVMPPLSGWTGLKFIARDTPRGQVHLEVWRDSADGAYGGRWERLHTYIDNGAWPGPSSECGNPVQLGPQLNVLFRNDPRPDETVEWWYKKASIREIGNTN